MSRKRIAASWFRRVTLPMRELLRLDIDMTEQAFRGANPSALRLLCAPSHFALWVLDELEYTVAELRTLLTLRRPRSRPSRSSDLSS
jgi:hypothetical protein